MHIKYPNFEIFPTIAKLFLKFLSMPKSFLLYVCLPYQFIHSPSVFSFRKCCFYFYIMVSIYILVYISKTLYFKTYHHPLALYASYSLSSPSPHRYQPSPEHLLPGLLPKPQGANHRQFVVCSPDLPNGISNPVAPLLETLKWFL